MKYRFKVGDSVRCKKKYSSLYNWTNMDALCKVKKLLVSPDTFYHRKTDGKRIRLRNNIRVEVVAHKKEAQVDSVIGQTVDVYDFHFKKVKKRDEDTFLLYRM